MRIIYTAQPIKCIVEFAHPPVETRVSQEKLKAIIEEGLMPKGLVNSYTITDDKMFPFPFEKPNVMNIGSFFGEYPDYNQVAAEINELYDQPKREFKAFETKLESDLEFATNTEILEMIEKFHYTAEGTRERYELAKKKLAALWEPYDEFKSDLEELDYNGRRKDLVKEIEILDNCHAQGLIRNIENTRDLLLEGKRSEAVENVMSNYRDWSRRNLAHLYNACGDDKFYGAGFWIARLEVPDVVEADQLTRASNKVRTVEEALENMQMPYQVIEIEKLASIKD